ncbi:Ribosome biogenesis protein bms1 [Zancudomyces culisetae]|uniref:Ribosome biogenesis protein bms1 n=1 Tax=Zancudomyces culisetae TaxID=1213189 RepID=A0A1R1PE79_ZANCU|nr:Ribosome biogenesis protein bms1 [Zancudomyces culisetae]|eukprot:OMH79229.1 Ribosome biogenesis protein bms1 [Zancudomyces culisetae]
MDANTKQTNKSHRVQKTGAGGKNKKRDKREKKKNGGVSTKGNKGNNPKAFAMQSGLRANRMAQRRIEKNERKLHLPLVDRTPEVPPPIG